MRLKASAIFAFSTRLRRPNHLLSEARLGEGRGGGVAFALGRFVFIIPTADKNLAIYAKTLL